MALSWSRSQLWGLLSRIVSKPPDYHSCTCDDQQLLSGTVQEHVNSCGVEEQPLASLLGLFGLSDAGIQMSLVVPEDWKLDTRLTLRSRVPWSQKLDNVLYQIGGSHHYVNQLGGLFFLTTLPR